MVELAGFSCDKKIAVGGMAEVYQGYQLSLQRPVAIKFLSDSFVNHPEARLLFEQESLIIAQLSHPNIVQVIDRGIQDEKPYFVMEYINGRDLDAFTQQAVDNLGSLIEIMLGICKGVAYAHQNGIIHRDLKPGNILIGQDNIPKILDFGIALLHTGSTNGKSDSVVGSRNYMSPEQLHAPKSVDHLTDVFALGVIMYKIFTGQLPNRDDIAEPIQLNSKIPLELNELILRCLENEKSKRPRSVEVIRDRLLQVTQGSHLSRSASDQANKAAGGMHNSFKLLDVISEKQFTSLYLFQDPGSEKMITMKKVNSTCSGLAEAKSLSKLSHPNIAQILGTSENDKVFVVVAEYLPGGPLSNHLHKPASESEFLSIAIKICRALRYAHENKVFHNNLHPENILFDENDDIKIIDFGLRTPDHNNSQLHSNYRGYSAEKYGKELDIFQAGAIFHHLLLTKPPKLIKNRWKHSKSFLNLPDKFQNILKAMLTDDIERRYASFEEVEKALLALLPRPKTSKPLKKSEQFKRQVKTHFRNQRMKYKRKPKTYIKYIVIFTLVMTSIELLIFFPDAVFDFFISIRDGISNILTEWRHARG